MAIAHKNTKLSKSRVALAVLVACSMNPVGVSQAQTKDDAKKYEQIVVTGSNIRRDRDMETPSPIETIGLEDLESAGVGQMQDIIKTLPSMAGSNLAGGREAQ